MTYQEFLTLKMDRKFIGIELKESYYKQAIKYLNAAKTKILIYLKITNRS